MKIVATWRGQRVPCTAQISGTEAEAEAEEQVQQNVRLGGEPWTRRITKAQSVLLQCLFETNNKYPSWWGDSVSNTNRLA